MFSPVPEHRPVVLSPWLYSLCLEPRDLAELPPESDSRLVAEPRKSWPPHLSLEPPAHTASCAQPFGWVSCPLFVGKAWSYVTSEPTKSSIVFGWGAFRATSYGLRTYHRDRISPASPQPLGPGLTCLQQSTGSLMLVVFGELLVQNKVQGIERQVHLQVRVVPSGQAAQESRL